jgi:hypothetical protein
VAAIRAATAAHPLRLLLHPSAAAIAASAAAHPPRLLPPLQMAVAATAPAAAVAVAQASSSHCVRAGEASNAELLTASMVMDGMLTDVCYFCAWLAVQASDVLLLSAPVACGTSQWLDGANCCPTCVTVGGSWKWGRRGVTMKCSAAQLW